MPIYRVRISQTGMGLWKVVVCVLWHGMWNIVPHVELDEVERGL